MLRYLATLGYGGLALLSMLLVIKGDNPWLWAIVILLSPALWFYLIGVPIQWDASEVVAFTVLGIIGVLCSWLLGVRFGAYDPLSSTRDIIYLYSFWGVAGVMCLKVGGSLFALIDKDRYAADYLKKLRASTDSWQWAPALLGAGVIIWQVLRLL